MVFCRFQDSPGTSPGGSKPERCFYQDKRTKVGCSSPEENVDQISDGGIVCPNAAC